MTKFVYPEQPHIFVVGQDEEEMDDIVALLYPEYRYAQAIHTDEFIQNIAITVIKPVVRVDLILLEILSLDPDVRNGGVRFIDLVKRDPATSRIGIVAMLDKKYTFEDEKWLIGRGCCQCITKPFDKWVLLAAVNDCVPDMGLTTIDTDHLKKHFDDFFDSL